MTSINRKPAGVPTGGQFAPTVRTEADLDLASDTDAPDSIAPSAPLSAADNSALVATPAPRAAAALASTRVRPFVKTLSPTIAVHSLIESETDFDVVRQLVPNLSPAEVAAAARDITDAISKAGTYRDALAAENVPDADKLVDLDEFGSWESDRLGEGPMHGYDFDAYALALSEAWHQNGIDRAKAAVALNDARAAASPRAVRPTECAPRPTRPDAAALAALPR